jgi:uncharacterized protein (TIGR02145 family)
MIKELLQGDSIAKYKNVKMLKYQQLLADWITFNIFTTINSYIIINLHSLISCRMSPKYHTLTLLISLYFFSTSFILFAQSGMTIKPGGAVTINGNTTIVPTGFICGNPVTDTRDGNVYNTVLIGTQCWMAQNLNYGTRINSSAEQLNNGIPEKYCSNNLESNCDIYGGLYEWAEMVQYLNGATNGTSWNPVPAGNVQGICPAGWHLPKDADWTVISTFLGGSATAGGKMKETGTTHWTTPNTNATNSSGFTGLPGGFRESYGGTFGLNSYGDFWSAEEYYWDTAWQACLGFNSEDLFHQGNYTKKYGVSVRCLKD